MLQSQYLLVGAEPAESSWSLKRLCYKCCKARLLLVGAGPRPGDPGDPFESFYAVSVAKQGL